MPPADTPPRIVVSTRRDGGKGRRGPSSASVHSAAHNALLAEAVQRGGVLASIPRSWRRNLQKHPGGVGVIVIVGWGAAGVASANAVAAVSELSQRLPACVQPPGTRRASMTTASGTMAGSGSVGTAATSSACRGAPERPRA
eukprot:12981120-Alexandrium_andersonii.AAC.1